MKIRFLKQIQFEKKIAITSYAFFLFFVYFVFILASVFFDFFCKAMKLQQGTLASRIIVLVILFFFSFRFRKLFYIHKMQHLKLQILIGIAVITFVSIFKIVYPDTNFDTLHYHLIAQRQGVTNYFSETQGFGKGNFQVWGFPLGDKAFWYFRLVLGYRLGTLLNSLALVVCHYQILCIFDVLFPIKNLDKKESIANAIIKSLFAVFILTSHYILLNIGTYMVDSFVLPFILEGAFVLITAVDSKRDDFTSLYLSILCGFCIALKMTNIIYVVPLVLAYVFKIRKTLTIKIFFVCAVLAIIPCVPFLLYNYHITNNPIFPYYNSFFKSDFYPSINFKDNRWGPENKIQALSWLGHFIFLPNNRISEIPSKWNFLYLLGILGVGMWFLKFAEKPSEKTETFCNYDYLAFITIIISILWGFTTGYARYFEGGMIFVGLFAYYFFEKFITFGKRVIRLSLFKMVTGLILIILLFQSVATIACFENGRELAWRQFTPTSFKENCKKLFKDRIHACDKLQNNITFYITESLYCGVADYAFPCSKIVNMSYVNSFASGMFSINAFPASEVYDIKASNFIPDNEYMEFFCEYGFNYKGCENFSTDFGDYTLVKFSKTKNGG